VQWLQQCCNDADTYTQTALIWDLDVVLNYGTVHDYSCFCVVGAGQACSLSVNTLHAHVDVGVASIMISPGGRLMTAGFLAHPEECTVRAA
jgi:hypothetical protein